MFSITPLEGTINGTAKVVSIEQVLTIEMYEYVSCDYMYVFDTGDLY